MSKELREAKQFLKEHNFRFLCSGANHDLYRNDELRYKIPLKRHRNFNKTDLNNLKREVLAAIGKKDEG